MSKWVLSLIWQVYIIKLPKIFFLCTYVDQMIIQQRFNILLQLQFYKIFFNVLSKVFTEILNVYELPKIYNKKPKYCQKFVLIIITYQVNSIPNFIWLLNYTPGEQRALLTLNFKKILGRIFFIKCHAKRVPLLLHQIFSLFSTINLGYVLKINIQIWIISSKYINLQWYAKFTTENRDDIWCNLMHLKKGLMGFQVRAFKNCNKWAPT